MLTDNDDLRIHARIDNAVRVLRDMRKDSRTNILGELHRCARRPAANHKYEHAIEAILTGFDLTRSDLAERIQAVIELDQEEEEERARANKTHAEVTASKF